MSSNVKDLLRQVLEPVSRLSQMTESTHLDDTLLKVHKQLTGLPANLYDLLEDEPDNSSLYPQNDAGVQVSFAEALDLRLKALKSQTHNGPRTPEIRLEPDVGATPDISLTGLESMTSERSATSTTLLMSKAIIFGNAHPKHCSSLLRLLYLHTVINPGNLSPHTPSLLVPLYSTLMQEVEPEELAHVEADTFWLLEALLAELSGLEDDGGYFWMKRFSERLAWANPDVFAELQAKGLDPALPHYSYRWLMTLLTHTLPLSALFPVWDVLFSCHGRERDSNPKLDFLIDFCSSMLIRAKPALFRLGKSGHNAPSLWTGETDGLSESISSVNEDAFLKEIYFLQHYSLKHVGGIERILQTAFDMTQRRTQETANALQSNLSLGARIKVNIWKGFTQQPSSNDTPPEGRSTANDYSDSDDTETSSGPSQTSIASRVSNTVWRGITNQTAMDSPPTPPSPESPIPRRLESIDVAENEGTPSVSDNTTATSNIWSYAEKLKDSNTVATLSKVGSNWRARAFMGTWGGSTSRTPGGDTLPQTSGDDNAPPSLTSIGQNSNGKWYSFSGYDSIGTRPTSAHQPLLAAPLQSPSENPLQSNGNTVQKSKSFLPTVRSPQATPKSAPRPLLLGSSSPILSGQLDGKGQPRSTGSLTTPDTEEWADVMMAKRQHFHRDSQSSISSLSPSDAFGRTPKSTRSGWDSDVSSSRIVSLNRRSVSPMAPNFRVNQGRSSSRNSSTSSEILSPPTRVRSPLQNSRAIDRQSNTPSINDINTTSSISHSILSPPNPQAVVPSCNAKDSDGSETTSNELSSSARKPTWKRAELEETGSVIPTRAARVRSKRYPRPANLQIQDNQKPRISAEQKAPSPSNLTVEWPREDIETAMTPKASNFESDDLTSVSPRMPKSPRSPHRSRKVSTGEIDRQRKGSTDTIHDSRPRKVSSGNRSRKISTESREIPTSQRESAAEEGDDEGYDELLSAYESEDGHNGSVMF
ncbi:hypothetical protein B0H34DRAFT_651026 [Crassisporium funariophilum]|nr:hypothetical protein B0H34DRAFT_651026 [Crassisporium funariophilum]